MVAEFTEMVWCSAAKSQSMPVPSGSENPFLGNQTDQFNSEVRTEEHSKITESFKSGRKSETT